MTEVYSGLLSAMRGKISENAEGELLEMISFISGKSIEDIRKIRLSAKFDPDLWNEVLTDEIAEKVRRAVGKRCDGVPVQYLTNRAFFFGREFYVDERVLIPRFDTETLVDVALPLADESSEVLDLCCGSGCIGLSLALEKNCSVTLADVSEDALDVCRINAEKTGAKNVSFIKHDVFSDEIRGLFDVIVCNPPYISADEMKTLDREVLCEPRLALEAEDGYPFYSLIPKKYFDALKNGGYLIFEVGKGQSDAVSEFCRVAGFETPRIYNDLNNIERVVCARKYWR
ncbi:MAG: peptide chain release factor N(5)-glutamine methyltransferase [Eubacteriales bacterium]|nr:peptide chain release factor N(5)-glutamine methyltransferase [Eubacteriales bacterium]